MRVALPSGPDWRESVAGARDGGAAVIGLPHLSFAPYVAAVRDRSGLEHAERPPSPSFAAGLELAGGAWLAASAYESEGEGVFYVTSRLATAGGAETAYRQRHLEAATGRYEQMFWSPGHEAIGAAELPWGPTATLVGYDLRVPAAWAELASLGVRVVVGGASEPADLWAVTRRVAAGMAAAYGMTVLVANRDGDEQGVRYAGGAAAFDRTGAPLEPGGDGIFEVEAAA